MIPNLLQIHSTDNELHFMAERAENQQQQKKNINLSVSSTKLKSNCRLANAYTVLYIA